MTLQEALKTTKSKTIKELASKIGVTTSAVGQWRKRGAPKSHQDKIQPAIKVTEV